jgi:hypothetical protein
MLGEEYEHLGKMAKRGKGRCRMATLGQPTPKAEVVVHMKALTKALAPSNPQGQWPGIIETISKE